ncbi:hypothetical protein ZIOFF_051270 [Zingiber officinale]|uniref:Uncharacterized protein n=1 Tax=Zingiber officinale TaxID=94328 RepID=A0A8J5FLM7_ZINOF|nr:hypothetical protein ZIOFF_051270 [Zingiber officinale]
MARRKVTFHRLGLRRGGSLVFVEILHRAATDETHRDAESGCTMVFRFRFDKEDAPTIDVSSDARQEEKSTAAQCCNVGNTLSCCILHLKKKMNDVVFRFEEKMHHRRLSVLVHMHFEKTNHMCYQNFIEDLAAMVLFPVLIHPGVQSPKSCLMTRCAVLYTR